MQLPRTIDSQTAELTPAFKRAVTDTGDVSGAANDDMLITMWLSGRPANTRRAYSKDIERLRCHVAKPLRHVTALDLINYAESLARLATSTQHRCLSSVKSLYTYAHRLGYIRFDPAAALRIPKPADNRASKLISVEIVRAIISRASGRDRLILQALYYTGARESELIAIRSEDIRRTTTGYALSLTGKGNKVRHLAIPSALAHNLLAHRDSGAVFLSVRGLPLDASAIYRIVRKAGERIGIHLHPHLMRHAAASHALDNGAPLPTVRKSLGHASLATTSIYTHCRPGDGLGLYLEDPEESPNGT